MWPIVGIVAKYLAREIAITVASHYAMKYAKKKIDEHKKVKDAEVVAEETVEKEEERDTDTGGNGTKES